MNALFFLWFLGAVAISGYFIHAAMMETLDDDK